MAFHKIKHFFSVKSKNVAIFLKVFICILTLFLFLFSIKTFHHSTVADTYEKRFTLIAPLQWLPIAQGSLDADEVFHTNTKLVCSDKLDPQKQADEINAAVSSGVDGIITAGTADCQELLDAIQNASDHGIPVVLVDSDLPESSRDVYIGSNNYRMGTLAAQYMIQQTSQDLSVAIVIADLENLNQQQRISGFTDEMKLHDRVKIVEILECHSDQLEILEKVPQLLMEHPEVNALYLTEAFTSAMVGNILKDTEFSFDLTIAATDDTATIRSHILDGTYLCSISQSPYDEGYQGVQVLYQLTSGQSADEYLFTENSLLTQENIAQENQTSEISYEDQVWYFY